MDPATLIIPIAVVVVVGLISRSARAHAPTRDGQTVIAYGWGFKSFAIFSGIVALAPIVGMFFVAPQERVWLLFMAALFGIPAIFLLLEGFLVRVVYTDAGIKTFSPWRRNRSIEWQEIARVSYSPGAKWHRVETREQGFVRLHEMKSGVQTLLQELKRRGLDGA